MTLSIRSLLLSLSALLAAGTLPACDTDVELEALGIELADIDAMSEEELDELPCIDELDLAPAPVAPLPPLPPVPRPPVPERSLVAEPVPFFAHTDDLLAGDKLGQPDDDDGCDTKGDELELAAG